MQNDLKRPTIFRADAPWLQDRRAAVQSLVNKDLLAIEDDGAIVVSGAAPSEEDLEPEERVVVYRRLGYTVPDADLPLIAKRAGVVGGRAAIAGRRIGVWEIALSTRHKISVSF